MRRAWSLVLVGLLALVVGLPTASAGTTSVCDASTVDAATFTGVTITASAVRGSPTLVEVRRGRQVFVDGVRCARLPMDGTFISRINGSVESTEEVILATDAQLEVGGQGGVRFSIDLGSTSGVRDRLTVRTLDNALKELVYVQASGVSVLTFELGTIGSINTNPATSPFMAVTIDGRGGNDRIDGRGQQDGIFPVPPFQGRLTLVGGAGRDVIIGGANNDVLIGGRDRDRLMGGPGNDRIVARDNDVDRVNGGPGTDACRCDDEDRVAAVER